MKTIIIPFSVDTSSILYITQWSIIRQILTKSVGFCSSTILPWSQDLSHTIICKSSIKSTLETFANIESYVFRCLMLMYQILKTDHHTPSFSQGPETNANSSGFHEVELQDRIKEVCKGHLRWSFDQEVLLASQSWRVPSKFENEAGRRDYEASEKAFVGSLQIINLSEFSRVFNDEALLVDECLRNGGCLWVDALIADKDSKSGL